MSLNDVNIWEETLSIMESELSKTSYQTWLRSTQLLQFQDNTVVIEVPNDFAKQWISTRYYNLVKNTMELLTNRELEVRFVLQGEKYPGSQNNSDSIKQGHKTSSFPYLNPRYTFETFVVGNSNRFAHAACLAVAESPAKAYNPLFIYGGVGLGKTHLMHAIGHFVSNHFSDKSVVYVTSEKFTNELINSIRDDTTQKFRNKYRNVDVLLIDDIQFLQDKERTQEEFFHTFNSLHEASKQIIISSDRPPKDIPTLEERLRSRFEWGLITDIHPPDVETRIAILRKKARYENIQIADDIMSFIAQHIQSNIRELEGALIRVVAYASVNNLSLDCDLAARALKDVLSNKPRKQVTVINIQKEVAKYFKVTVDDLKSKKRHRPISYPRQIAMFLCRDMIDHLSLPKIGEEFGGRDHTTVIHACEKITAELELNSQTKQTIENLKQSILQN